MKILWLTGDQSSEMRRMLFVGHSRSGSVEVVLVYLMLYMRMIFSFEIFVLYIVRI